MIRRSLFGAPTSITRPPCITCRSDALGYWLRLLAALRNRFDMALPVVNGTGGDDPNLAAPISTPSVIYGFGGDDAITGSNGDDFIFSGNKVWRSNGPSPENFDLVGDDDVVLGGAGDDWIYMGPGSDVVDGGPGIDNADFADASGSFMIEVSPGVWSSDIAYIQKLVVDLSAGTYSGEFKNSTRVFGTGGGTLTNIERVTGTIFDDVLKGSSKDESFRPLNGTDTMLGRTRDVCRLFGSSLFASRSRIDAVRLVMAD